MRKMFWWIFRLGYLIFTASGFYGWSSRVLQRWLDIPKYGQQWKYIGRPQPRFSRVESAFAVSKFTYKSDALGGKLDRFRHPSVSQSKLLSVFKKEEFGQVTAADLNKLLDIDRLTVKGPNDCDDSAIFAASLLDWPYRPQILTVFWQRKKKWWKSGGHNVCVYWENGKIAGHMGNWGDLRIATIGREPTMDDVANDVISKLPYDAILVGHKAWYPKQVCYKWD